MAYSWVIPYMSGITLYLGLSIFEFARTDTQDRADYGENWRESKKLRGLGPRCRVSLIPDM